ncbi:MAG: hypothetical protein ACPGJV_15380 [Bacteriovoracaceae bacterium]
MENVKRIEDIEKLDELNKERSQLLKELQELKIMNSGIGVPYSIVRVGEKAIPVNVLSCFSWNPAI